MKLTFLLAVLLCSFYGMAQAYFPFKLNTKTYYTGVDNEYTITLQAKDSQVNLQPKIYTFAPTILPTMNSGSMCLANGLNSILGSKVYNYGDTLFTFLNIKNEHTYLKLNTTPGNSWTGYDDSTFKVEITHDSTYLMLVNRLPDVINSYSLNIYNKKTSEYLPKKEIVLLGKYNGLIQFPCFYTFPYHNLNYNTLNTATKFMLAESDIHNITWDSIYNLHVGDEFHTITINFYHQYMGTTSLSADTIIDIFEIKQSYQPNADSIGFLANHIAYRSKLVNERLVKSTIFDTIYLGFNRDSTLDFEPGLYTKHTDYSYAVSKTEIGLNKYSYIKNKYNGTDTCFNLIIDAWKTSNRYFNGLGGPYYENIGTENGATWNNSRNLVFYKKGNKTWGIPFSKTVGVNNISNQIKASVFPNPATETLTIQLQQPTRAQITVYDYTGKLVDTFAISEASNHLNISTLKPGIYLYVIKSTNTSTSGKFIKQ